MVVSCTKRYTNNLVLKKKQIKNDSISSMKKSVIHVPLFSLYIKNMFQIYNIRLYSINLLTTKFFDTPLMTFNSPL